MKEITLNLTIEDTNLILEGLGNMPFNKVYGLIAKLQEQAGQQLRDETPVDGATDEGVSDSPVHAVKE